MTYKGLFKYDSVDALDIYIDKRGGLTRAILSSEIKKELEGTLVEREYKAPLNKAMARANPAPQDIGIHIGSWWFTRASPPSFPACFIVRYRFKKSQAKPAKFLKAKKA